MIKHPVLLRNISRDNGKLQSTASRDNRIATYLYMSIDVIRYTDIYTECGECTSYVWCISIHGENNMRIVRCPHCYGILHYRLIYRITAYHVVLKLFGREMNKDISNIIANLLVLLIKD